MSSPLMFDAVVKDFSGFRALAGLSFELRAGEVLGLLGHNGAGKTTTMKLALGVIAPSAGMVKVLDEDPVGRHSDRLRRVIGYLPENVSFYQQLSGREILRYFARLKGVNLRSVDPLLEQVGLADAARKRTKYYSKGMRQRLGLAQALLGEPRLLLLDEPTAGLDPQATREFYAMIDDLKSRGVTILISSHVLPGIERHIDRAAILGHGRLLAVGSLPELRARARLPLTIRVQGELSDSDLAACSSRAGLELVTHEADCVELQGAPERKLEALRCLVNIPGIDDIDVKQPSLESLYVHFNRGSAVGGVSP